MKRKRKFLNILFAVGMALCLLLCFCGCKSYDDYNKHTHVFTVKRVVSPTCTEEGYTDYTCKCGIQIRSDYIPALENDGHAYENLVCTRCGDFLIDEAVDTAELRFGTIKDEEGNVEAYRIMGVTLESNTDDFVYIKIPSTYRGLPVTEIANEAFWNFRYLKHVVLPDSIISIGRETFQACFNLMTINIPDGVVSIGQGAFWDCDDLKSISLGGISKVENYTFIGCRNLTDVVIPEGVTSIGASAFESCALTSVTIPKSVEIIYHAAYADNENLRDIFYKGTMQQWLSIYKEAGTYPSGEDASWDANTGEYTVHCSDGNIIPKK